MNSNEEKRRVFIAVNIPAETKQQIQELVRMIPSVRAHPMENFHITVKFIGDATNQQIDQLFGLMDFAGQNFPAFPVGFKSFRIEENRLRLLVSAPDVILDLHKTVEHNLSKIGLLKEDRLGYRPHITLGRVQPGDTEPIVIYDFNKLNFLADRVSLFETVRGEKTAMFKKLKEVIFTGQ